MTSASVNIRPTNMPATARQVSTAAGAASAVTIDPIKILKKYKWLLAASCGVGVVIGFVGQKVLEKTSPTWRSTITYQVLPPVLSVIQQENPFVDREEFERQAATQARIIVADRVIRDAVELDFSLRDRTEWAKKFSIVDPNDPDKRSINAAEAARDLKDLVSARVIAGTSLVEVSVSASIPDDALTIANAIHEAYWRDMRQQVRTGSADKGDALILERTAMRKELENLGNSEAEIINKNEMGSSTELGSGLANLENELNRALTDLTRSLRFAESEFKKLDEQLKREGGVSYTDDQKEQAERDPLVSQHKTRISELKSEDESLAQRGWGENHKDRQAISTKMKAVQAELDSERGRVLEKIFMADLDKARRQVDGSNAQMNDLMKQREAVQTRRKNYTLAMARLDEIKANRINVIKRLDEVDGALREITLLDQLVKSERIGRIRRVETPRKPDQMAFPRLQYLLPIGVLLALGLTGGAVVLREVLDQRVRGPADIAIIPRMRLVGIVPVASEDPTRPANPETAFRDAPTGAVSEGFRQIRAAITKRFTQTNFKSLLVMAGMPGSGATTTAANLAMGFAASDMRVLLIDANFRRPNLHRVLKVGEGPGLADVLAKKGDFKSSIQQTSIPNLSLLAAGSAGNRAVPERLSTPSMNEVMREAQEQYDMVIIDTAPGMVAGDGIVLANKCDATLMVLRAMSEKRGLVARLRDQLSDSKSEFLGVIVNAVRASAGGYMRQNIKAAYEYQAAPVS